MMKLIQLRNQEREIQLKNEAINMSILKNKELPVSNNRKIQITDDLTVQENDEVIKKKLTDKLTQTTDVKTSNEIISKLDEDEIRVLNSNFSELLRMLPDSLSLVELKQKIKKLLNDKMSNANILEALKDNKLAIENLITKDDDDDNESFVSEFTTMSNPLNSNSTLSKSKSKSNSSNSNSDSNSSSVSNSNSNSSSVSNSDSSSVSNSSSSNKSLPNKLPNTIEIFNSNLNELDDLKDKYTVTPNITIQIRELINYDNLLTKKIAKQPTIKQINKLVNYFQQILATEKPQKASKLMNFGIIKTTINGGVDVVRDILTKMLNTFDFEIKNDYWILYTLNKKGTIPNLVSPEPINGKGIPKKAVKKEKKTPIGNGNVIGKSSALIKSDSKQKFAIDLDKLNNNILSVIYLKSKNAKIKPQLISDNAKTVIMDIIENKFVNDHFQMLNSAERRLIECFTNCLQLDIKVKSDETKELLKNFEILKGQFLAGNNNEKVITALKNNILELLNLKMIPHSQAYNLLFRLNN